jgi:antitoxin component YwqK of YwqJK toxin-antitoxin module
LTITGIKQGLATLTMANGDKVSYNYKDDQLDGSAEYTYGSGVREVCNYVAGVKEGAATECNGKGDEEERTYVNGVLKGLATLRGSQGDKMEFSYRNGKRFGAATYYWSDGSREVSCYDDNGEETGPCKLIWANGAAREGQKLNGQWDGEVFYTYGDGPRKGKKDKEEWKAGELVSSQKYFGHGEDWEVENWDDLKQMQDVTKSYMMSRQLV